MQLKISAGIVKAVNNFLSLQFLTALSSGLVSYLEVCTQKSACLHTSLFFFLALTVLISAGCWLLSLSSLAVAIIPTDNKMFPPFPLSHREALYVLTIQASGLSEAFR